MTETTPSDVGSILKQARLRRGQSLEVVFQHTRIQKKFLEALEANRFDEFPAQVYLRGFLKIYCDHLDVDFEHLWQSVCPPAPSEEAAVAETAGGTASSSSGVPSRQARPMAAPKPHASMTPSSQDAPASPLSGPVLWIVLALGTVGGAVYLVNHAASRPPTPAPAPPVKPPAPIAPLHPMTPMKLKVLFRREAWLSVRCDGQLRFEGRAPAGTEQPAGADAGWTATGEFTVRTASPEDIVLRLDGAEFPLTPASRDPAGSYHIKRSP